MKRTALLALMCWMMVVHPAISSEQDLYDLSLDALLDVSISVASKKEEKIIDAPGVVTVISKQEIEGFAAQNLGQILNRVVSAQFLTPDVFMERSIVFRGQEMTPYNNHVLVLLNGRPVRDPITGGGNESIYGAFPLETIDHIEIIRGPGSVLYGSCAYSGVINIQTKTSANDGMDGSVGLGYGSYDSFSQNGRLALKDGDLFSHFGFSHLKEDGPEYAFTDYEGVYSSAEFSKETTGVFSNTTYKGFTANTYFGLYDPYSLNGSEHWNLERPYFNRHQTFFFDLGYSESIGDLTLTGNYTRNMHRWTAGETHDFNAGNSDLYEAGIRYDPIENLHFLVGGGYERTEWEGAIIRAGDQNSHFFYGQADYKPIKQLKLVGGVQYNKIENLDGDFSPRVGLIANMTESLGCKLLYSEAFRKGYANETSFAPIVFRGNPDLKPEKIKTYEAQVFYITAKLQSSLTYFQSKMSDIITRKYFPDPESRPPFYLQYLNGGTWDFHGVEFDGKYQITDEWFAMGSATYQTNETEDGLDDATLHPNWMGKIGILYAKPAFSVGVFDSYFGEPEKTTHVNPDSAVVNPVPEDYHLVSAKISVDVLNLMGDKSEGKLVFSLEGDNLLDKDVRYPDYPNKRVNSLIPLNAGRTVHGKISWAF